MSLLVRLVVLATLTLLAPRASAQTVLVVDDDGGPFTDVQAAVDAALPGDVVLVHPGSYPPFAIDGKGVVVHNAADERPQVAGPVTVANLAAGGSVTLRGLEIRGVPTGFLGTAEPVLTVRDCAGPVWIEALSTNAGAQPIVYPTPSNPVGPTPSSTGTLVSSCASVVFAGCDLESFYADSFGAVHQHGLHTQGSTVAVYDSRLQGGTGRTDLQPPADVSGSGLFVEGGTVFVSGSELRGGDGHEGEALAVMTACLGADGGDGGDGVRIDGGGVTLLDSQAAGGSGGVGAVPPNQCPPGTTGQQGLGVRVLAGSLEQPAGSARGLAAASPVRAGETIVETFRGEPGDLAVLVYSPLQAPAATLPDVTGVGFVGSPFFFLGMGLVGASGEITFSAPNVGILDPGFEGVPIHQQAVFLDASAAFHIGSPSLLLLLNPPF